MTKFPAMLTKIFIASLILLTLFLNSCVVHKHDTQETTEGLSSLKEIDGSKTVLLIEKLNTGEMYENLYNKRRMNDCKQFYKGQVEAVIYKDLEKDPRYKDKKIYRLMLVDGSRSTDWVYSSPTGATKTNTHTITDYFLLDRLTGKQFDLNIPGVNRDRVFKKAVQKLNTYMFEGK